MRFSILVLCHLLLLALVVSADNPNFFPFVDGAHWRYVSPESKHVQETAVIATDTFNDRRHIEVLTSSTFQNRGRSFYEADGYLWTYRWDFDSETSVPSSPEKTYKLDLKVGDRWSSKCNFYGRVGNLKSEAVTKELVEVPGGRFEAIKVVQIKTSENLQEDFTYWVVDGVGIVKSELIHPMNRQSAMTFVLEGLGPQQETTTVGDDLFNPQGLYYLKKSGMPGQKNDFLVFRDDVVQPVVRRGYVDPKSKRSVVRVNQKLLRLEGAKEAGVTSSVYAFPDQGGVRLYTSIEDQAGVSLYRSLGILPRPFYGIWANEQGQKVTIGGFRLSTSLGREESLASACGLVAEADGIAQVLTLEQGTFWLRLFGEETLCLWNDKGEAYQLKRRRF